MGAWQTLRRSSLLTLAVTDDHFEIAAEFVTRQELGLRAGDALHLAIARDSGHTLATLDTRMASAAPLLGVSVEPI